MWLISLGFGFGKTRAVQCYVTLLVWIILVSLGFYWILTRNGSSQDNFKWTLEQQRLETKQKVHSNYYDESVTAKYPVNTNRDSKWKLPKKYEKWKNEAASGRLKEPRWISNIFHSSVTRLCNPPEEIRVEDENLQVPEFKLDAMIIVFRHGDRGPLSHVGNQNLSLINCSSDHPDFQKFFRFSTDSLTKLGGYSQFIGPFHSFQKVPTSGQCNLGQLSQLGSWQLLQLGKVIQSAYQSALFNSPTQSSHVSTGTGTGTGSSISSFSSLVNNTASSHFNRANAPFQNVRVVAYSTRYRRTLQSLMAFLYGLLGPKLIIPNVIIRESQSINFCFNDCSCRTADKLKKSVAKKYRPSNEDKASMISLVNQINSVIGLEKTKKSGTTLLDLLLLYSCHKSDFPCRESKSFMNKFHPGSAAEECVTNEDVASLISLLQKENQHQKKIPASRQLYLLSSYGLLKEIVNLALKMTSSTPSTSNSNFNNNANTFSNNAGSGDSPFIHFNMHPNYHGANARTKIAIFSGHDTTLQSLTGALGIFSGHPDIHLVPYASRLIFEFYRKTNVPPNSARKHFFRIIYNGQAVTHLVRFCQENDKVIVVNTDNANSALNEQSSSGGRNVFCPLENLVRFLHDHYFDSFGNVTNFKDACQKKRKKRKR